MSLASHGCWREIAAGSIGLFKTTYDRIVAFSEEYFCLD
jgi:hypothetical protein